MTLSDLHLRAVIPVPFRVCGVALMPMTVGHARIIEGLELRNAVAPLDLMSAAWICSRPPTKFAPSIQARWLRAVFRFWQWRLGRRWNWTQTRNVWREYVEHHFDEPFASIKGKGQQLKTPWLTHLRSVCCGQCGYSPETFDGVTMAQALIDYHAYAEREGLCSLGDWTVSQMKEFSRC